MHTHTLQCCSQRQRNRSGEEELRSAKSALQVRAQQPRKPDDLHFPSERRHRRR